MFSHLNKEDFFAISVAKPELNHNLKNIVQLTWRTFRLLFGTSFQRLQQTNKFKRISKKSFINDNYKICLKKRYFNEKKRSFHSSKLTINQKKDFFSTGSIFLQLLNFFCLCDRDKTLRQTIIKRNLSECNLFVKCNLLYTGWPFLNGFVYNVFQRFWQFFAKQCRYWDDRWLQIQPKNDVSKSRKGWDQCIGNMKISCYTESQAQRTPVIYNITKKIASTKWSE